MTKQDYIDCKFRSAVVEEDDFDLLVMGRTQGKGCYCYVNGLLQTQLQKLEHAYRWMVVDNEAGMEHISRGILPAVDYIVLVSDCSRRGIQAVGRIAELVKEVGMKPKKLVLVVNRAPDGVLNEGVREEIGRQGLELIGVIPQDQTVYEYDCEGKPTTALDESNSAKKAVVEIAKKLFA
jgi:CO dehydrogenase maturation factor